jgi:hypothetical protein
MVRRSPSISRAAVLVAVLVLAGAWIGWQELYAHGGNRPLAWHDLTARTIGEPLRSELRVLRSRRELQIRLGRSATVPAIDFGRRDAILVAAGPRSSSAYALEIVSVRRERRRIIITVRERTPSLARPGAATLTFPFRLITIPRSDNDVELDWEGRP